MKSSAAPGATKTTPTLHGTLIRCAHIFAIHVASLATSRKGAGRKVAERHARKWRTVAVAMVDAPDGTFDGGIDAVLAYLDEHTTVVDMSRITDELNGVATGKPSEAMRSALNNVRMLQTVFGLSQVLGCSEGRAVELLESVEGDLGALVAKGKLVLTDRAQKTRERHRRRKDELALSMREANLCARLHTIGAKVSRADVERLWKGLRRGGLLTPLTSGGRPTAMMAVRTAGSARSSRTYPSCAPGETLNAISRRPTWPPCWLRGRGPSSEKTAPCAWTPRPPQTRPRWNGS